MGRKKQIDEQEDFYEEDIDPNDVAEYIEEDDDSGYQYEEDDGLKELDFE